MILTVVWTMTSGRGCIYSRVDLELSKRANFFPARVDVFEVHFVEKGGGKEGSKGLGSAAIIAVR